MQLGASLDSRLKLGGAMKILPLLCLACTLSAYVQIQAETPTCAPSPQVEQDLRHLDVGGGLLMEKAYEARKKIFAELIQQYPNDLFVNMRARELYFVQADLSAMVERYRKQFEADPNNLQRKYLYARALVGNDTPHAMELLKQVEASDPAYGWPHLEFAVIHQGGKYADVGEVRTELGKFFEICPNSLNWSALSMLQAHATPEIAARYAPALRERLMTEPDRYRLRHTWKTVWNLEFKAAPVSEHEGLRKKIAADVARLEQMPGESDAQWLEFLKAGYGLAADQESVKRIDQELLAKYPDSREAKSILDERWWKEHRGAGVRRSWEESAFLSSPAATGR
jgi:hypothetical protein